MRKQRYRNELIKKRRKRKLHRNLFVFFLLTISILITLCLKLSYFNINNIEVNGNKMILSEDIIKASGICTGNNIFYISTRNAQKRIKSNSYIENVKIKRVMPNKLIITVSEKKEFFYSQINQEYIVMDGKCSILDVRDKLNNDKLVMLTGITFNSAKPVKVVSGNERKIKIANEIWNLYNRLKQKDIVLSSVDLISVTNINVYFRNMRVIVGTEDNMKNKLNKAINVLSGTKVVDSKGYVDVSFNGNPVVYIEK